MLPGLLAVDGMQTRREPLNTVSNTEGRVRGPSGAMQKLASEKAARKAKSSAAVLMSVDASDCASGALASLTAQGVDLKMPSLPSGTKGRCYLQRPN